MEQEKVDAKAQGHEKDAHAQPANAPFEKALMDRFWIGTKGNGIGFYTGFVRWAVVA